MDSDARPSLSARLRDATRDAHRRAERAGAMPALLAGRLPLARYGALLANLRAVYAALEAALASAPARAAGVDLTARHPSLARLATLDADLARLAPRLPPPEPLVPEARAYVRHLEALAIGAPERLAAHAYLRYLGDLSGGQILRRVVGAAYGDPGATAFYAFDASDGAEDPGGVAALAGAVRDWLDALPLDAAGRDAVVAEALDAFARHERLFAAV
jgi:heme oxygenase